MTDEQDLNSKTSQQPDGQEKTEGEKEPSAIEPEILDKLPPDLKKAVESFSLQAFTGPVFHPILKKITESHIDKVLDQTEKDNEREFQDRKAGRRFGLIYALIGAALFVFLTIYLVGQDKEIYQDVVTKIIIFFGGGGLGYGLKAYFDRE